MQISLGLQIEVASTQQQLRFRALELPGHSFVDTRRDYSKDEIVDLLRDIGPETTPRERFAHVNTTGAPHSPRCI